MIEHLKVLTSEIQSAQLINKILLEELKRTDDEYKIAEKLPTYRKLKSQIKTYPISESEIPDRNFKNLKKTSRKENWARKSSNPNN
jgi:hypothetical protein